MQWNDHSRDIPRGSHAFLSPSSHSWIRYDQKKLIQAFRNNQAKERGTKLHALAAELISFGIKQRKSKDTFCSYVNDAIGYGLRPEQPLKYSDFCYGTSDAIAFDEKKGFLRIHDFKSGITKASMEQLYIYAALFCLEYGPRMGFKPSDIEFETRIYQNSDIIVDNPDASEIIIPTMDIIRVFSGILEDEVEENGYGI